MSAKRSSSGIVSYHTNQGATYENLVQEVLDELLVQRTWGQQTVKICSKKLSDKVTIGRRGDIKQRWVQKIFHGSPCPSPFRRQPTIKQTKKARRSHVVDLVSFLSFLHGPRCCLSSLTFSPWGFPYMSSNGEIKMSLKLIIYFSERESGTTAGF